MNYNTDAVYIAKNVCNTQSYKVANEYGIAL